MRINPAICALIATFAVTVAHGNPIEDGKTIFRSRCASCHNVNKVATGPALAGVHERRSIDWIVGFVQSSQTMVKNQDKDAIALFEKFNKIPMPDHKDLNKEQILNIVEFIKAETKTTEKVNTTAKSTKGQTMVPLSIKKDWLFFVGYMASILVLVIVLLFATRISEFSRGSGHTQ